VRINIAEDWLVYESIAWNWIVLLVGVVAALLVLREAFLWYWKLTKIVKLLEEHSQQNRYILESLQTQEKRYDTVIALLRQVNERCAAQGAGQEEAAAKPEELG